MQANGLVNRQQFVKTVGARRPNAQPEVDLGEGSNGDSHRRMIVTAPFQDLTTLCPGASVKALPRK